MAEIRDNLFDGFFHAVEILEGWIDFDHFIGKDTGQARILPGIHEFRFANRCKHPFRCGGVYHMVVFAEIQIFLEAIFLFFPMVPGGIVIE